VIERFTVFGGAQLLVGQAVKSFAVHLGRKPISLVTVMELFDLIW
jgi:hypothetical protein